MDVRVGLWRKLSAKELMLLNCGKDSWESLGLQGDPPVHYKGLSPGCSLEGMMLKLKLQYFGHLMRRTDSLEKTLMLGGIGGRRRRQDRRWDGWMASLTRWIWVWVNSGSWWWTGRPGVLWFMGSQRVRQDWATELNWRLEWISHRQTKKSVFKQFRRSLWITRWLRLPVSPCIILIQTKRSESHSVMSDSLWPHGLLQARILEWVAFPFSRGSSQPRDRTQVSHIAGGFFTSWATREAQFCRLPIPIFCPFLDWDFVFLLLTKWHWHFICNIPCRYLPRLFVFYFVCGAFA